MNPKKALKKGLASITEEEFINAMKFILEEKDSDRDRDRDRDRDNKKIYEDKYPIYHQIIKMTYKAAKDKDELQIMQLTGMATAIRILSIIAEQK